jgi:hypothetical protein
MFSCENCVSFWKEFFMNLRCLQGAIGCICSIRAIQLSRGSTCTPKRKVCMVEALASSTMFPFESWIRFWEESFLQFTFFKAEKAHFIPNSPTWLSWRNTGISRKETISEAGAPSTLFSCENCVRFGKEYFLQPWSFKVQIASVCSK